MDGINLLPLLQGGTIPQRPLFFYTPFYELRRCVTPCAVIRERDWFDDEPRYHVGHKLELFNLRTDLGETRNLAESEKEHTQAMQAKLHAWMKSIAAPIPGENPHFDAKRMLEETKVKQAWNR